MNMSIEIIEQHLIDPELCIRCNTCQEHCPVGAISNDGRNYVVDVNVCNHCRACVPDCPTGSINNWQPVLLSQAYSLEAQFKWDALPEPTPGLLVLTSADDDRGIEPSVSPGRGAPPSASTPVENRYTRGHPAQATIKDNVRLTDESSAVEIRHIVLDMGEGCTFLEGQSIGIIPPGVDPKGRPFIMRLYSVASSRSGEQGQAGCVAITVKRVVEDPDGKPYQGVCSNYVCNLQAGDRLEVVGPYGASFLMPDDPDTSLMMICTGTGIAPMRGMIERRRELGGAGLGKQLLFYGARRPEDLPYLREFSALPPGLVDMHLAYSRVPEQPKAYVQDKIREQGELVAKFLADPKCYVYLCGLKGMEAGVLEAFSQACADAGLDWSVMRQDMEAKCRLHIETY